MKPGFAFQAGGKTWVVKEVIQSMGADIAVKQVDPLTGDIRTVATHESPVEVVVRLCGYPIIDQESSALPDQAALPAPDILLEDHK